MDRLNASKQPFNIPRTMQKSHRLDTLFLHYAVIDHIPIHYNTPQIRPQILPRAAHIGKPGYQRQFVCNLPDEALGERWIFLREVVPCFVGILAKLGGLNNLRYEG